MNHIILRCVALVLALAFTISQSPTVLAQAGAPQNQQPSQTGQPPIPGQPTMPPVNPGQLPENPAPMATPNGTPPPSAQPTPEQAGTPQPTGTAAAQSQTPAGTAGSKPAGAAIAPPKQRQVRSFLIKMGIIAGAGVALGTVYALSAASPSRVPGAPTTR